MSTIDDLSTPALSDMSQEEAFELLRQIRLSRRTSKKTSRSPAKAKAKAMTKPLTPAEMSPEQAAQLLKLLGGA